MVCAIKMGMEAFDIVQRSSPQFGQGLIHALGRAHVTTGVDIHRLGHRPARHRVGVFAPGFQGAGVFLHGAGEFIGRKARRAQHIPHQLQNLRHMLPPGLKTQHHLLPAARHRHLGVEPLQQRRQLRAAVRPRAAHQQVCGQVGGGRLAHEAGGVAHVEPQLPAHGGTPVLLGQQRQLHAAG